MSLDILFIFWGVVLNFYFLHTTLAYQRINCLPENLKLQDLIKLFSDSLPDSSVFDKMWMSILFMCLDRISLKCSSQLWNWKQWVLRWWGQMIWKMIPRWWKYFLWVQLWNIFIPHECWNNFQLSGWKILLCSLMKRNSSLDSNLENSAMKMNFVTFD